MTCPKIAQEMFSVDVNAERFVRKERDYDHAPAIETWRLMLAKAEKTPTAITRRRQLRRD